MKKKRYIRFFFFFGHPERKLQKTDLPQVGRPADLFDFNRGRYFLDFPE